MFYIRLQKNRKWNHLEKFVKQTNNFGINFIYFKYKSNDENLDYQYPNLDISGKHNDSQDIKYTFDQAKAMDENVTFSLCGVSEVKMPVACGWKKGHLFVSKMIEGSTGMLIKTQN